MSSWFWRVAMAAGVVLIIAAGVNLFFDDDSSEDDDFIEVSSDDEALSVKEAIQRNPGTAFALRGYVYDDGAFVQLCHGLTTKTDPPTCRGPSVLVHDLDLSRLALLEGELDGRTVLYSDEPVILGGTLDGTQLSVLEIFASQRE